MKSSRSIGDAYHFNSRVQKESFPTSIIKVKAGETYMVTVELFSVEDASFPLIIQEEQAYHESHLTRTLLYGLYLGLMLLIFIFNLIMYINLRHRVYLIYSTYVIAIALMQSALFGDPYTFLYGESAWLSKYDVLIFAPIVLLLASEFFLSYFSLSAKSRIYKVIRGTQLVLLVGTPITLFINIETTIDFYNIINMWAAVIGLLFSAYLSRKGDRLALIYFVSWGIFLFGTIIYVFQNFRLIPYTYLGNYAMPIGTAIEAVLLTVAVGYRMNVLRRSSIQKDNIIKEQEGINQFLNTEVSYSHLRSLRAQMNPHFLFNALNTVQGFIVEKDLEHASYYLGNFSGLLRTSIDLIDGHLVTLEKELEFLNDYVKMEAIRLGNLFKFNVQVSNDLDSSDVLIPPYLIQPFIENSIKHGFNNKSIEHFLQLSVEEDNSTNRLQITIEDNGSGFNAEILDEYQNILQKAAIPRQDYLNHLQEQNLEYRTSPEAQTKASRGIKIIAKRLEILNNLFLNFHAKITIKNKPDAGTIVILNIPIIPFNYDNDTNY